MFKLYGVVYFKFSATGADFGMLAAFAYYYY